MKYLTHLTAELQNYFAHNDDERRNDFMHQLIEITDGADKEKLIEEIRNDFPQKNYSGLSVIYEGISENPEKWGDFYVAEFQRAYKNAVTSKNAFEILQTLNELCFIEDKNTPFGHEIIQLMRPYLQHKNPEIRHQTISRLGDWLEDGNEEIFKDLVCELKNKLSDKNWKVRHVTELVLKDLKTLPPRHSRGFLDKMRIKYFNPFEFS